MTTSAITWRDKLRYRFENTLSRGTIAIIGWLALLSTAIIVLAALILAAMRIGQDPAGHEHPYGFFEGMWQSMLRTLDPGVVAGDSGWQLRLLMLVVTIGGAASTGASAGSVTGAPGTALTSGTSPGARAGASAGPGGTGAGTAAGGWPSSAIRDALSPHSVAAPSTITKPTPAARPRASERPLRWLTTG